MAFLEKWKRSLDNHGYAGAVIMDLSEAFNTINYELLTAKLHAYGFTKAGVKAIIYIFIYVIVCIVQRLILYLVQGKSFCRVFLKVLYLDHVCLTCT